MAILVKKMSRFETGKLNFTETEKHMVESIIQNCKEIKDALQYPNALNDAFYTAVKVMCETAGYNHQKMLNNCKVNRASYSQMANLENQLKEFERIYNYKTKQNNRLYFSDYMRNRGYNVRDYNDYDKPFNTYGAPDISSLKPITNE